LENSPEEIFQMQKTRLLISFIILALLSLTVAGCKGPPEALFEADVTTGQAPLTVTFSNTSRNADNFQWDFGDGSNSTTSTIEEPIVHEYTKAGTHTVTLIATNEGREPQESSTASLTVTVVPHILDAVTLPPVQVAAGEAKQLEPVVTDRYGNILDGLVTSWSVANEDAGSITQTGLFNAGEVAGTYSEAVELEVMQGELFRTAVASVSIRPGPLGQVVVAPDSVEIGMEMAQQFVAVGADQYGNRVSGLNFTWSVESGGGSIGETGLFIAEDNPGTYTNTVKVEAVQGSITQSATASVTVEPDRIAFLSSENDEQFDIYLVDVDGSNMERLTSRGVTVGYYSYSPDGRRIIFNDVATEVPSLFVINHDGTWETTLLSGRKAFEPSWSPDGTKIAFQSWEHEPSEIYIMDVDGGNLTRLTDNSSYDDYPSWSPDGTKIAFVSDRDGNAEIYVMNADGSNQRRLTNNSAPDFFPNWSPDGTEIVFQSDRDQGRAIYIMNADGTDVCRLTPKTPASNVPSMSPDGTKIIFHSFRDSDKGEIYVMDRDGSNIVRLTNNSTRDVIPRWVPRKEGIEVSEVSIIIPYTSTTRIMTVQEVTAQVRKAVVRIETDIGSGSGFIIDTGGLIMTCNHVIRDADEITVYLEDGASYTAIVEARDLVRDLAVVKIEATGLPRLEMGDLGQVSLGQQVVVLGYPLEAENVAVTSGLFSTVEFDSGRNITWAQTDSAINPGNSGGPLLDLQGKVIGVVSVKMVGIAVEGVGFAISANTVNLYLARLIAGESIMAFK
jgi:Tol biopolymer transport system component